MNPPIYITTEQNKLLGWIRTLEHASIEPPLNRAESNHVNGAVRALKNRGVDMEAHTTRKRAWCHLDRCHYEWREYDVDELMVACGVAHAWCDWVEGLTFIQNKP